LLWTAGACSSILAVVFPPQPQAILDPINPGIFAVPYAKITPANSI
jgi:hypothetical protein